MGLPNEILLEKLINQSTKKCILFWIPYYFKININLYKGMILSSTLRFYYHSTVYNDGFLDVYMHMSSFNFFFCLTF